MLEGICPTREKWVHFVVPSEAIYAQEIAMTVEDLPTLNAILNAISAFCA